MRYSEYMCGIVNTCAVQWIHVRYNVYMYGTMYTYTVQCIHWESLTTADVTTADSTANVTTVDVLVLGCGL